MFNEEKTHMRTGGGQEEDTRWFWCPESEICDLHSHLFDGRNVSPLYRNTPKSRKTSHYDSV